MWKKIKDEYFIIFTNCKINNDYELSITNYVSAWTTLYSSKAFIAQLKANNEGLELENDQDFLRKGLYLLSNLDQLKNLSITKEDAGNSLFITMKIMLGYPFYFECKLSKGSDEFYFKKVTLPLLKTIGDLRSSQTELRRLLIKKDKEIDEYKSEGGEIVLRHLKTIAFNDEEHMMKHKTYEENFGIADIPISLIENSILIPEKNIKQECNSTPGAKEGFNDISKLKQESNDTIKYDDIFTPEICNIKQEPHTPMLDDIHNLLINCQKEVHKTECQSSQTTDNNHRKKKKLNL